MVKRIYISGPMTGYPELNYPAFDMAAKQLRALGYTVISPHEINPQTGLSYEECLRADVAALLLCDSIALLPGYEKSKGAALETAIGKALGMKIGLYSEFLSEDVPLIRVADLSPEEAAKLESVTIGETLNHEHLADVLRVQRQTS